MREGHRGWGKRLLGWGTAVLGTGGMVGGLSALASLPLVNVLTLGYLLESSGRVARGGRLRDGFPGVKRAAVLGGLFLAGWILYLPLRVVAGFWRDARLLEEGGRPEATLATVLAVLCAAVAALLGVLWIVSGRRRPDVLGFVAGLRLPYLFWLGLRGLAGGVAWLALPVGLMWMGSQIPGEESKGLRGLLALLGGGLLTMVVMVLPFLQTRFAETGRMEAFWRVREAVRRIHRAPLACLLALTACLALSLPLYLGKVELPPRELGWLPALFFIVLGWPARLALGWSWHRTGRREKARAWPWVWLGRAGAFGVAVAYAVFVWLTQYLVWTGANGMLEQHAFLLPAPAWSWE